MAPDVEVTTDRGLIEIGQGEWEGRTHAELAREDAARYSAWRTHEHAVPPGAEPLDEARARALAATRAAITGADEAGTWPLCLVTHGGTIRLVATELLGIDLARGWGLDVDNAALCILGEHEGGWRIERWNDVIHLLRGGHALTDDVDAQTTQRPAQDSPPRAL